MKAWIIYNTVAKKVLEQVLCNDGETPRWSVIDEVNVDCMIVEMPRTGDLSAEQFNPETREWETRPEFAAEQADFNAGKEHIKMAHMIKLVQAMEMLGLPSLVEMEADALGIDPMELAQSIVDKANDMIGLEVNRRKIKKGKGI